MRQVFGRAVTQADVRIEFPFALMEHDDSAAVHPDVVVNCRGSAVPPVGQHDAVVADRAVIVVVVPAEDRHHVPALKHLAEKARVEMRGADCLTVGAVRLEVQVFSVRVGIFRERNMHERHGRKRLSAVC